MKTLCLDFDGVCSRYALGWQGPLVINDGPVDGLFEALLAYISEFEVAIYSIRSSSPEGISAMRDWFAKQETLWAEDLRARGELTPQTSITLALKFPDTKPPAFVGLDDRVITFTGTWPSVAELANFKPWYQS